MGGESRKSRPRADATPGVLSPQRPDAIFDEQWYLTTYPDVAAHPEGPWHHYITCGDAERRWPGPTFDPDYYAHTYLELEAPLPGHHYIFEGRPRGYQTLPRPRTHDDSARAMRAALARHPRTVVLVGHDARRAGAPILLAELASHLRVRGFGVVFVLLTGGPLLPDFQNRGRTFVLSEGWDAEGLGSALGPHHGVIGNTAWSAPLMEKWADAGPRLLLVHEMRDYLVEHDLVPAVRRQRNVVVATALQAQQLAGEGVAAAVVHPGLMAPPRATRSRRRVGRALAAVWGRDRLVFIGAGYADHRKGFDLFLDAAHRIHCREPRARFVWLGEMSSPARSAASRAITDGLPLLLPGFQNDAHAWYRRAQAFLLTSRQDPGPATVMDAAMVGTPFVALAADIGLRSLDPSILEPVGRFVDPDDLDAFADAALETARRPGGRRRRASWVARHASFATYASALLVQLRLAAPALLEPPKAVQRLRAPLHRLRPLRHRARVVARVVRRSGVRGLARALPEGRVRDILEGSAITPISVAITDAVAPDHAVGHAEAVRHLRGGDRAWIADVSLLRNLTEPAVVHFYRSGAPRPPALLAALADAAPWILEIHQHHADSARSGSDVRGGAVPELPPVVTARRRVALARVPRAFALRPQPAAATLPRPIGVFLHLFHDDLAPVFARQLDCVDHPLRLYISTDTEAKASRIREVFPDAEIRVMANVGRDMYPKLFGFADRYALHDVVLHLHSKRSPHDSTLEGWLTHILDRVLGTRENVNAILELFASGAPIGMVSPAPYPRVVPSYGWTTNRPLADVLTWDRGWGPGGSDRDLAFPAGSMFWARSNALDPIRALDLGPTDFVTGDGLHDGTLPHALERLLGLSCAATGQHQVFVDLPGRSLGAAQPLASSDLARRLRRPPSPVRTTRSDR